MDVKVDADNLSKPVWDSLKGVLFTDDSQIRMRVAGSFDITKPDFNVLGIAGLEGELAIDLAAAAEKEDHIIYVECGKFDLSMVRIKMEFE